MLDRPAVHSPPATIDDVIARLDEILAWSRQSKSRLGYFAALYRKVTVRVKDGIARGEFDDGPRMERLDIIFAGRYLEAFDRYRAGETPTKPWQVAFEAAPMWWPIVLQHLLLGINAHINLDLGIAAAQTGPGAALSGLRGDFNRINEILASLVDGVEDELGKVWPLLKVLDWIGGRTDEQIIHFSIERARDEAWAFAQRVAGATEGERVAEIALAEARIAALGRLIRRPGILLGIVQRLIRLAELRSVRRIINILM
ncbi:MAG: DUF5995 family protein [Gemmatimonadetes bacterium]|nr:DUF5995 family protein [Gemmatimonadota bacterium]